MIEFIHTEHSLGFRIPSCVKLFGTVIIVEFDEKLVTDHDCVGISMYREARIKIQPDTPAYPRTQQQIEHTFFHELTHFILDAMVESELRTNEKFVDVFSGLLHQALTSMEYDNG